MICTECAELIGELLKVMQEHLKAEGDLYHAAFVIKDAHMAHQANLRAASLLQRSTDVRARFKAHRRAEHDKGDGWELIEEMPR